MKKFLITGIGNPGENYKKTRHNMGFLVLEQLAKYYNTSLKTYSNYEIGIYSNLDKNLEIIFLKPLEYMNLSGNAVLKIQKKYSIDINSILVIHDELDFEFLKYKMKFGGGSGGHNGLKHISEKINRDYHRFRIGIGRPKNPFISISDYVLSNFVKEELKQIELNMDEFIKEINLWIEK